MLILSFVLAFVIMLPAFAYALMTAPWVILSIVLGALTIMPLIMLLANLLSKNSFLRWVNETSIADKQKYFLEHKEEARRSFDATLDKLTKLRRATYIYSAALILGAVASSLLGGLLLPFAKPATVLFVVWSGILIFSVLCRSRKVKQYTLEKDDIVITREQYPEIYALADRAAKTLGCNKKLTIILIPNCNASILRTDKENFVLLGVGLLSLLCEDELYCVFLHELSHASEKHSALFRERAYAERVNALHSDTRGPKALAALFFIGFDVRYFFNITLFEVAASLLLEEDADRDVVRYGNAEAGASVMIKLAYDTRYGWESDAYDFEPFFAPEEHSLHATREIIAKFKARMEERSEFWDELIDKEILANNASHPTTKMRLEALGYNKAEILSKCGAPAFACEVEAAIDLVDARLYELHKDEYKERRKESYLEPLETIEKWQADGSPIVAGKYEDAVSALMFIGRVSEGEEICQKAIDTLDANSIAFALFKKASLMLARYEFEGVELMYKTIELNPNYMDEGLDLIGNFLCLTGRESELIEYRKRAVEIAQKNEDETAKTAYLSKSDRLTRDDMPTEMLEDILAYMHSLDAKGIINRVFLVKKTVSDSFFASVFVIHFWGGTDDDRQEIMHGIFRYLDSYPVDRHFSLFDYFEYPDLKLEKIEGSIVYDKKENKNP